MMKINIQLQPIIAQYEHRLKLDINFRKTISH